MKPSQINLFNSCVLLFIGMAGFYANNFNFHTAIIPIGCGLLFLILNTWLKRNNITGFYVVLILSSVLCIAFIWPLIRNIEQKDHMGIMRISLEMLSCFLATLVYVKYIVDGNLKQIKQS